MWHNRGLQSCVQFRKIRQAAGFERSSLLAGLLLILAPAAPRAQQLSFRETCERVHSLAETSSAQAEAMLLSAALRNPPLALRETQQYLPLPFGQRVLQRIAEAAPDEAMSVAAGGSPPALSLRHALLDGPAELRLLAELAQNAAIDLPTRRRVAVLAGPISRLQLSLHAAVELANSTPKYFAQLVDRRAAATGEERIALDGALQAESIALCRAAQQSPAAMLSGDLARLRDVDLYLALAFASTETADSVFPVAFDRLLLPKWRAEKPAGASLNSLLSRNPFWMLQNFAVAAVNTHRFDAFLSIAGPAAISRLALNLDQAADPLQASVQLAEMIAATASNGLLNQMAALTSTEYARCVAVSDSRGQALYRLLAARLIQAHAEAPGLDQTGAAYVPLFTASDSLNETALFDRSNRCVQRYFFWDDDDGVESFANFRAAYQRDPAWIVEDHAGYLHVTGHGPTGRLIEIFANVPIDAHLPANRSRENEASTRQQAIAAVLQQRNLTVTVLVHRGHSFHVEKTLAYVTPSARLVILGSCRGAAEIHKVIDASHSAQVIATRGVGATGINDTLLKNLNRSLLAGQPSLLWPGFWQQQQTQFGRSALFQSYTAPNQDPAAVFLRAYYSYLDAQ